MDDVQGSAVFSDDGRFRWRLDRWWANGLRVLICGCNPSKAGATENDPTIIHTIKLIRTLGYPGFTMVNWSPYIATNPQDLREWREQSSESVQVEPKNVGYVGRLANSSAASVVAWGNLVPLIPSTDFMLYALSCGGRVPLMCFGTTKGGAPKHPMARGKHRIDPGTELEVWRPAHS